MSGAAAAIRAGEPVLLPTDTVYGLCGDPGRADVARRIARLKGRDEAQPLALLARDLAALLDLLPELRGTPAETACRALLPGPFTLVVPVAGDRLAWLSGARPGTLGVRVPELPGPAARVLAEVGAVVATSANLHGGRDPRSLDEVPAEIRAAVAAEVDAGELPGTASTVVDLVSPEPRILREGAVPAGETLARVRAALA